MKEDIKEVWVTANKKTFSRNDALSRHIKIKHGIVGDEALELINEAKENVEYHPVTIAAAA